MAEFDNEKNVEQLEETVLETREETPVQEEKHEEYTPIEKVNTAMAGVEKSIDWIGKYGVKKVLQGILVITLIAFLAMFMFKPESFFKSYENYREKVHTERMDKRNDNTPLIQQELDNLRIRYDASWVSVWELHNNTNNLDGLPFIFASLNYESMNPGLIPIAEQFDNVRLSLYPLSTYLRKNDMWYGDVEGLKEIDYSAYYRAKALGIKYIGFKLMQVDKAPNAVLSFAYVEDAELPNENDFVQAWMRASYKINGLLTVDK